MAQFFSSLPPLHPPDMYACWALAVYRTRVYLIPPGITNSWYSYTRTIPFPPLLEWENTEWMMPNPKRGKCIHRKIKYFYFVTACGISLQKVLTGYGYMFFLSYVFVAETSCYCALYCLILFSYSLGFVYTTWRNHVIMDTLQFDHLIMG